MKQFWYHVIGISCGLSVFLSVFFIYGWYHHTIWVQDYVQESWNDYQEHSIDWARFDPNGDKDALLEQVREATIFKSQLFTVCAYEDEELAYEETLYEIIRILVNDPEREGLIHAVFDAAGALAALEHEVESFVDNRLWAMRCTI